MVINAKKSLIYIFLCLYSKLDEFLLTVKNNTQSVKYDNKISITKQRI